MYYRLTLALLLFHFILILADETDLGPLDQGAALPEAAPPGESLLPKDNLAVKDLREY